MRNFFDMHNFVFTFYKTVECLWTVTPEQIQDILGHITEGVCRPFKVYMNNLVYFTIILTLVPSSYHYIDCLLLFIFLYCDNFSSENIQSPTCDKRKLLLQKSFVYLLYFWTVLQGFAIKIINIPFYINGQLNMNCVTCKF